jgi:macrolide transport system ATP-binding/permease protein
MAIIGEWIRRLDYLLRRRTIEEQLRREMEAHRELLGDNSRAFGNTLRLREEARDVWGWNWLDDFVQDARVALRVLRQSPGFTVTAIVTLALGIGVNIGVFSVVDAMLLRPLYERPDEVVSVSSHGTTASAGYRGVSYPNYLDLQEGTSAVFETLAASSLEFVGLEAGDGARRALAAGVTANYFNLFGRPLALGRPFTAEEERRGGESRVAIISHSLWRRRRQRAGSIRAY